MKKRWVAVIGTLSLVSGVLLGVFLTKKNAEIKYKELKERWLNSKIILQLLISG